jgi:hypothetical protein
MAKFSNPLGGNNEVFITQTLHGSSNTAIDLYGAVYKANLPVYAIADGKVGNYYSSGGSYISQYVDNSDLRVWYVHIWHTVPNGSYVKKGQKIGEIAPKSVNGGYAEHLHLGLTPKGRNIMNYFDRSIPFRTKYADIKKSWFKTDGTIDWRHFQNLSYKTNQPMGKIVIDKRYEFTNSDKLNVRDVPNGEVIAQIPGGKKVVGIAMSDTLAVGDFNWNLYVGIGWGGWVAENWSKETSREITDIMGEGFAAPDCSELESKVKELEGRIKLLNTQVDALKIEQGALQDQYDKDMATWEDKYGALRSEKDRIASEKAKCQVELSKLKNHRFNWVLEFLDKIIPKKNV